MLETLSSESAGVFVLMAADVLFKKLKLVRHSVPSLAVILALVFGAQSAQTQSSRDVAVQNGIDVLAASRFESLEGWRLGLITNPSGVDAHRVSTIDLLFGAPKLRLKRLFSPEHGIRGDQNDAVDDELDPKTKLPIVSLFGAITAPKPEHLADLDALVFDIQDVGTRFFTYISTLKLSMIAASEAKIKFVVLDRVNPLGGEVVEGPVRLDREVFVGIHPIPIRHGMTVGELALMFKEELKLPLDLRIIKVAGWNRASYFDQTGLTWLNPSPIMNGVTTATFYPGVALLEFALSVGRGTDRPFEHIGAPYIEERKFARALKRLDLAGVEITAERFVPSKSLYASESCGGVGFKILDRARFRPLELGLALGYTLYRLYPQDFPLEKFNILLLNQETILAFKNHVDFKDIVRAWNTESATFKERRQKFLLY